VDVKLIDQIQNKMNTKSTEDLHNILDEHNQDEWSDEAFEAIQRILRERGENQPTQLIEISSAHDEIPSVSNETISYKAETYVPMKPGAILHSFNGRISRGTFLKWWPANMVIGLIGVAVANTMNPVVWIFCMLTILWPLSAILVKRWHDRNRTTWLLLTMITVFGIIWVLFECFALKGTAGTNKFGPDPLGK
jgi:uncharacterized membrane protein YhaH (DUF805 family)